MTLAFGTESQLTIVFGGILLLGLALSGCAESPQNTSQKVTPGEWPQWLGPGGLGVSTAVGLPVTWSADVNIRWKTPIPGTGNSSPIVSRKRVFLTTSYAEQTAPAADPVQIDSSSKEADTSLSGEAERLQRAVLAVDLGTGEILWQTPIFSAPPYKTHARNTNASPTPATDGEHVYAYFATHLAALDLDGRLVWREEIDPDYPRFAHYGIATSPVVVDDRIIVAQDKEEAETDDVGWMAAFDKRSGRRLWRVEWQDTCCSYTTPLVWRRGDAHEVIFFHSGRVTGYDPLSGERLWSQDHDISQPVASPMHFQDLLFVMGGAHLNKGNLAFRLAGTGADTEIAPVWSGLRYAPENASPVIYRGMVFTVADGGFMTCYDAATGKVLWKHRLPHAPYRASLVAGDGKIYAMSSWGAVMVIEASPKLRILAKNLVNERGNASPAIAGGCLLIRTNEHLMCIEKGPPPAPVVASEDRLDTSPGQEDDSGTNG